MKVLTPITLYTTLWAALALAQPPQIAQVKGSLTNYGTNGFDPTPPGTGTGLFVPEMGKLFVSVRGEPNAEVRVYETR